MLKRSTVVRLGAILAVSALPYALLRIPAARSALLSFVAYVRGAGPLGALALLGFDVVWALAAAPFWCGRGRRVVYGFPLGVAIAVPSTTLATCVASSDASSAPACCPAKADARRESPPCAAITADGRKSPSSCASRRSCRRTSSRT